MHEVTHGESGAAMPDVDHIKDGDDYPDGLVICECGESVRLWWNGGELDRCVCKCGLVYRGQYVKVIVCITRPGEVHEHA